MALITSRSNYQEDKECKNVLLDLRGFLHGATGLVGKR